MTLSHMIPSRVATRLASNCIYVHSKPCQACHEAKSIYTCHQSNFFCMGIHFLCTVYWSSMLLPHLVQIITHSQNAVSKVWKTFWDEIHYIDNFQKSVEIVVLKGGNRRAVCGNVFDMLTLIVASGQSEWDLCNKTYVCHHLCGSLSEFSPE